MDFKTLAKMIKNANDKQLKEIQEGFDKGLKEYLSEHKKFSSKDKETIMENLTPAALKDFLDAGFTKEETLYWISKGFDASGAKEFIREFEANAQTPTEETPTVVVNVASDVSSDTEATTVVAPEDFESPTLKKRKIKGVENYKPAELSSEKDIYESFLKEDEDLPNDITDIATDDDMDMMDTDDDIDAEENEDGIEDKSVICFYVDEEEMEEILGQVESEGDVAGDTFSGDVGGASGGGFEGDMGGDLGSSDDFGDEGDLGPDATGEETDINDEEDTNEPMESYKSKYNKKVGSMNKKSALIKKIENTQLYEKLMENFSEKQLTKFSDNVLLNVIRNTLTEHKNNKKLLKESEELISAIKADKLVVNDPRKEAKKQEKDYVKGSIKKKIESGEGADADVDVLKRRKDEKENDKKLPKKYVAVTKGKTMSESAQIKKLKEEIAKLKKINESMLKDLIVMENARSLNDATIKDLRETIKKVPVNECEKTVKRLVEHHKKLLDKKLKKFKGQQVTTLSESRTLTNDATKNPILERMIALSKNK